MANGLNNVTGWRS